MSITLTLRMDAPPVLGQWEEEGHSTDLDARISRVIARAEAEYEQHLHLAFITPLVLWEDVYLILHLEPAPYCTACADMRREFVLDTPLDRFAYEVQRAQPQPWGAIRDSYREQERKIKERHDHPASNKQTGDEP